MSIDDFVAQVSASAIQTNNPVFTRQLAEHSYARVQELKDWGFFDSPIYNRSFMKPLTERQIPVHERIMITHLLKENGRIVGASGFMLDEQRVVHYLAKSVILCTGSGGFKPNGFPMCDLTHDGTIMAYKAGAKVTGKEWNDGHPGSAKNSGSSYDNWHGQVEEKPSTTDVTVNHHLGVDLNYQAHMLGGPITMGPPGKDGEKQTAQGGPYVPEAFRNTSPPTAAPAKRSAQYLWQQRAFGPARHGRRTGRRLQCRHGHPQGRRPGSDQCTGPIHLAWSVCSR